MAAAVGCEHPFPMAETLPDDNGEQFFSEYLTETTPKLKGVRHGEHGECLCPLCTSPNRIESVAIVPTATTTIQSTIEQPTPPTQNKTNNVNSEIISHKQQAIRPQELANWRIANTAVPTPFGAPFTAIAWLIPMAYQMPFCHNNFQYQYHSKCCRVAPRMLNGYSHEKGDHHTIHCVQNS